jgi:16S rRNA processing protein RimM
MVKSLLETGANDVLVIKGDTDSIDREERLIPYVEQFVTQVDMTAKKIDVIWDPEF